MLSTALCIEAAPSPPLKARPGPNMTHYCYYGIIFTNAAIVIHRRPNAIPQVVVDKYPKVIKEEVLGSIATLNPP